MPFDLKTTLLPCFLAWLKVPEPMSMSSTQWSMNQCRVGSSPNPSLCVYFSVCVCGGGAHPASGWNLRLRDIERHQGAGLSNLSAPHSEKNTPPAMGLGPAHLPPGTPDSKEAWLFLSRVG